MAIQNRTLTGGMALTATYKGIVATCDVQETPEGLVFCLAGWTGVYEPLGSRLRRYVGCQLQRLALLDRRRW